MHCQQAENREIPFSVFDHENSSNKPYKHIPLLLPIHTRLTIVPVHNIQSSFLTHLRAACMN